MRRLVRGGKISIKVNLSSEDNNGIVKAIIYNVAGIAVAESIFIENSNSTEIDLSQQPAGLYIVSLFSKNKIFHKKIIKE